MTAGSPLPFTVIGGFLGAGKTTLLNHLLRHAAGERIAVLVNDFGAVAIDADLVAEHSGDTIALANGCICCAVAGELALALPPLLAAEPPFDRVVVECSGIADPGVVAQFGTVPGFRPDGVVVAADASTIEDLVTDGRLGRQITTQLDRADLIVLTKVDLMAPADRHRVTAWAADRWPEVSVITAVEGRVDPAVLFDTGLTRALDATGDPLEPPEPHGVAFESCSFRASGPVDRRDLDAWLDGLDPGVVRVKGIVTCADRPTERATVHRVGRRRRWRYDAGATPSEPGRLALIALAGTLAGLRPPPGWSAVTPP